MHTHDAKKPMKTNDSDAEKHNLYYTDPHAFTGTMTQVMKAVFLSPDPDQTTNVIQVADEPIFDCTPLPNLNETFSDIGYDGFDQTPQKVFFTFYSFICILFIVCSLHSALFF